MPSGRWVQTLTGLSSTNGFPIYFPDWAIRPFGLGISVAGSSATYNVEISQDYTGSSAFISSNATWFSSLASAQVSSGFFSVSVPVSAVRLNVTAGSSTATTTITAIQAG
jgi:hypothetical protein